MISLTVQTDLQAGADTLRRAAEGLPGRIEEAVAETSRMLEEALQDEAPVGKTQSDWEGNVVREGGRLRDSIRFDLDGLQAEFAAADYAGFVIGGTVPHVIAAKTKSALSFQWGKTGGWATFARVNHPGTKANDFRTPALETASGNADDELNAIADWFEGIVA